MTNFVTDHGAVADGVATTAILTISAGSKNLASTTSLWSSGDVGKTIRLNGAGEASGALALVTTIASFTNATHIVLTDAAVTALSSSTQRLCWGTNNDSALADFNSTFAGQSNVTLTVPAGVYVFNSPTEAFGEGIRSATVTATGATFSGGLSYGGGAIEIYGDGSAFVQTVTAGSTGAVLIDSSHASRFTNNQWCMLGSLDLQGFGHPPNLFYRDFLKISSIAGGNIGFTSAATLTHKSTWPLYDPGVGTIGSPGLPHSACMGGPATLYALNATWDIDLTINGLTIFTDTGQGVNSNGRVIAFVNCAGDDQGPVPSVSSSWTLSLCNFPNYAVEVDKCIDDLTISGCTLASVFMQSSSPKRCNLVGNTLTSFSGGGQNVTTSGNTCGSFNIGVAGYGRTYSWQSSADSVSSFTYGGVSNSDVPSLYSLASDGTISTALYNLPVRWAIPDNDTWVYFAGALEVERTPIRVVDLTSDGGSVYDTISISSGANTLTSVNDHWTTADIGKPIAVQGAGVSGGSLRTTIAGVSNGHTITLGANASTTLSAATFTSVLWGSAYIRTTAPGTWPSLGGASLNVLGHPCPLLTMSNVTGCQDVLDFSIAPVRSPIFSYRKRTYTMSATGSAAQAKMRVWGAVKSISINVVQPSTAALSFNLSQSNNWTVRKLSDNTTTNFGPIVNCQIAGERIITPTSVSGVQSGDTIDATLKGSFWFGGESASGPKFSTDLSSSEPNVSVIVTIETDEGISSTVTSAGGIVSVKNHGHMVIRKH